MKLLLTIAVLLLTLACNAQDSLTFSGGGIQLANSLTITGGTTDSSFVSIVKLDTVPGFIYYYTSQGMVTRSAVRIDYVTTEIEFYSCREPMQYGGYVSCLVNHHRDVERRRLKEILYRRPAATHILDNSTSIITVPFDLSKEYHFVPLSKISHD